MDYLETSEPKGNFPAEEMNTHLAIADATSRVAQ